MFPTDLRLDELSVKALTTMSVISTIMISPMIRVAPRWAERPDGRLVRGQEALHGHGGVSLRDETLVRRTVWV